MRRFILFFLAAALLLLTGCGQTENSEKIEVVTAIFPEYDWVRQIVGEDDSIHVTLLVDDGVDAHSFQPSVSDMVTVSQCDLLIYGGGESDAWLKKAVLENENDSQHIIELIPLLGENAHTEEIIEGMQSAEEDTELDEHVWLSLRNAAVFCENITDSLCELNPSKADYYRVNLQEYLEKLQTMDEAYENAVSSAALDTIIVCDRFPFRYMAEDYGLNYYAAFPGCSSETSASFETMAFLAEKTKELAPGALLILENSTTRFAQTVAENAGLSDIPVLVMDSMQAVSGEDAQETDYLTIMESNLSVLKQALR